MRVIKFVEQGLNIHNHSIVIRVNSRVDSIQFRPHIDLKIPRCTRIRNDVGEGIHGEELIQHVQRLISECGRERYRGEAALNCGVGSHGYDVLGVVLEDDREVACIPLDSGELKTEYQQGGKEERRAHASVVVDKKLSAFGSFRTEIRIIIFKEGHSNTSNHGMRQ